MVRNALLQLLPAPELHELLLAGELVPLVPRQVLHHYKLPLEHIYFIEHGLVSVAAKIGPETFTEVWLAGADGMVGATLALADSTEPLYRRTVQVGGQALRIKTRQFRDLLMSLPQLRAVLNAYLAAVLVHTSQSGACNAAHPLKQRLARWLLLARRALASDEIPLTHAILAQLLSVRRASITDCLDRLERDQLIRTDRGLIAILSHRELLKTSCDCFRIIDREYERQLASFGLRSAAREPRPIHGIRKIERPGGAPSADGVATQT
jgi:CRP-like cAMP-binding protein